MADTLVDPQTGLVGDGVRTNPDGSIGAVGATTLHLLPGRLPWGVRRVGRARRAPPVGRPRRRGAERHHRQDGRVGWGDSGVRRRRRGLFHGIAARYWPTPPCGGRSWPRSPPRLCWPPRKRPGREAWRWPAARCSRRTGADRPAHPTTASPRRSPGAAVGMDAPWAAARAAGAATTQQGTRPGLTLPSTAGVESIVPPAGLTRASGAGARRRCPDRDSAVLGTGGVEVESTVGREDHWAAISGLDARPRPSG